MVLSLNGATENKRQWILKEILYSLQMVVRGQSRHVLGDEDDEVTSSFKLLRKTLRTFPPLLLLQGGTLFKNLPFYEQPKP